ncbi:MAG: hypothetical protein GVY19_01195 [Bacteroidetes bacterium]|jgi:hypothetical protein|nr:hypothetical protein [Bacteroidota bacterium]
MAFLLLLIICASVPCYSQTVYEEVTHKPIYEFIDEMANEQIIDVFTAVKPYSRKNIARWLLEIQQVESTLTLRQRRELGFYLQEFDLEQNTLEKQFVNFYHHRTDRYQFNFSPSSMRYRDTLFRCSVRPIVGLQYGNNQFGTISHFWYGVEGFAYVNNFAMYASLRENDEEHRILSNPEYLNPRNAAIYVEYDDYTEARGGITYSWNWGHAGLVKDYIQWGNHYHYPSIISNKAPSFTQLKYELRPWKWLTFHYFHAWLVPNRVSGYIDQPNQQGNISAGQNPLHKKFMAGNMVGVQLFSHSRLAIGNTVVYTSHAPDPGYLFPLFIYGAYNNTLEISGRKADELHQNAQLFIDFSFREIRKLHVYGSIYLDDFQISRFNDDDEKNIYNLNVGLQLSNVIPNVFVTMEYYRAMPLVYQHDMASITFNSNEYYMGHYLQDNSEQLFAQIAIKPFTNSVFRIEYLHAVHGPDYFDQGIYSTALPFINQAEWKRRQFNVSFRYTLLYNVSLFGSLTNRLVSGKRAKYTLPFYHGNTQTISAGFQYGF